MGHKDTDSFSVESEITELKVNVARVDERLKSMSDKQDCIQQNVNAILGKMGDHTGTLERYKSDRKWVTSIFGVLYAAMLAWIEYRSK